MSSAEAQPGDRVPATRSVKADSHPPLGEKTDQDVALELEAVLELAESLPHDRISEPPPVLLPLRNP